MLHSATTLAPVTPPQRAIPSFERPLDLVHLARQTLGDPDLEAEVLALFVTQSSAMLARIAAAVEAGERQMLAHTFKGSARAVGAWKVAAAAEAVELWEEEPRLPLDAAIAALRAATEEVCQTIAMLGAR